MKNWIELARITLMLLSGIFGLTVLTGCESLKDTAFAPLDAKLEPLPQGGAQCFVVANTSGQALRNVRFRAYMWDDRATTYTGGDPSSFPNSVSAMTYTFTGFVSQWEPGQVQRFRDRNLSSEIKILKPVSRVQIVGSCDAGHFREDWRITESGQLQPIGNSPRSGQP